MGRPEVLYENASEKTRRRRNAALANIVSIEELCDTASKKMKIQGNKNGAKLITELIDHGTANELMTTFKASQNSTTQKMSPDEALEMLIKCNLTKSSYNEIRRRARRHGHDLYPSYKHVMTL